MTMRTPSSSSSSSSSVLSSWIPAQAHKGDPSSTRLIIQNEMYGKSTSSKHDNDQATRIKMRQKSIRRRANYYEGSKCLLLMVTIYACLLLAGDNYFTNTTNNSPRDNEEGIVDRETTELNNNSPYQGRHLATNSKNKDKDREEGDYSNHSCELIHQCPESQKCNFATTCNGGDGIFLGHLIYCSSTSQDNTSSIFNDLSPHTTLCIVSGPLALLLILLFRILGSTAEEFFSPGLEMLSLKLGLPERFAGVTLLALGNGAPDVASTVSAIRNDSKRGYLLALGELTGASMVATTLIVGVVAWVAPTPVPCRVSLIRDIVMFIITLALVFAAFQDGSIDPHEIRRFILLYIAYVLLVLGADLYRQHQKHYHSSSSSSFEDEDLALVQEEDAKENIEKPPTETTSLLLQEKKPTKSQPVRTTSHHSQGSAASTETITSGVLQRLVGLFTNYDDDDDDSEEQDDEDGHTNNNEQGNPPNIHRSSKTPQAATEEIEPERPRSHSGSVGWGERNRVTGDEPLMVFHPHHGGLVNLKTTSMDAIDHHAGLLSLSNTLDHDNLHWWQGILTELKTYFQDFLNTIYGPDSDYNAFDKILMTFEIPFTVIRMLTIPVPCDGYYCRPLLALSVALSPIWMCVYFHDQFEINLLEQSAPTKIVIFGVPLLVGLVCLRFSPRGSKPPGPLIAVPVTMIGFAVSATYLDYIADKIVDLLTFFGVACRIPSSIMGITVLAWGNASQDLIANMTVAKKDLSTMAITASFAGPVFNILVGLGISYAPYVNRGKIIPVQLDNTLRSSFLFCILNGMLMIAAGIWFGKGTIPKHYGYVAAVVYTVYAVVSLTI